jgi:hypothetical protein
MNKNKSELEKVDTLYAEISAAVCVVHVFELYTHYCSCFSFERNLLTPNSSAQNRKTDKSHPKNRFSSGFSLISLEPFRLFLNDGKPFLPKNRTQQNKRSHTLTPREPSWVTCNSFKPQSHPGVRRFCGKGCGPGIHLYSFQNGKPPLRELVFHIRRLNVVETGDH